MSLVLFVNGKKHAIAQPDPTVTLLEYLRGLGLSGTKLGCGEGGCGACTVMVSHFDGDAIIHRSVNACLAPLCSLDGMHVITVEGIGNSRDGLHPIQARMAQCHASQCGFCTPGIVMSMYTLLRNKNVDDLTVHDIEENFDGNLCRCTGYRPILDAFRTFAGRDLPKLSDATECFCGASNCTGGHQAPSNQNNEKQNVKLCPSTGKPCTCTSGSGGGSADALREALAPSNVPSHLIFPPELKLRTPPMLDISFGPYRWFRPTDLNSLLSLREQYPTARLIVGNTEVGIENKFRQTFPEVTIAVTHIPELNTLELTNAGLSVGASVTYTRLLNQLRNLIQTRPEHETRFFVGMVSMLRWWASTQIRNVASVGGNVCTASPICDMTPLYVASGCVVTIVSSQGTRQVEANDFLKPKYRTTDLQAGEIMLSILIPFSTPTDFFGAYKASRRKEDDIALVNAGLRVSLDSTDPNNCVVKSCSLVYGGVAAYTVVANKTMALLEGKRWSIELIETVKATLAEDVPLEFGAVGGMVEYRRSLVSTYFFKFLLQSLTKLGASLDPRVVSATSHVNDSRGESCAIQFYDGDDQPLLPDQINSGGNVVGQPVRHMAGDLHATGEAVYCDDAPVANAGYAAFVLSTEAHARILAHPDITVVQDDPGFAGYADYRDVPGTNKFGPIVQDEEIFAEALVQCRGQVIAVVVSNQSPKHARELASRLERTVRYEVLPAITSLEEAIELNSAHLPTRRIVKGDDVHSALETCDGVVEGDIRVGGQEHFYLETQACIVVPGERNEIKIISSTQCAPKTQKAAAHVLGIPESQVVCSVKRLGGGFGGKETRSVFVSCALSVVARKTGRAVRVMLDRDHDMIMTGTRAPFIGKYKVGFSKDGRLLAAWVRLYCNSGYSCELSPAVLERAMFHAENSYLIPHMLIEGVLSKTNLQTATAFRGFGGPQGMLICETYIAHVAHALNTTPEAIRLRNLYTTGDATPYRQVLNDCHLRQMWAQLTTEAEYEARETEIQNFNKQNRYKKRGIAMVPVKFGMSFTATFMNQSSALVHIYTDGSVLVTHGGVEMGQGINTKMAQVAATVLEVPLATVYIDDTSTDKVANTHPTAASVTADLNGMAVLDACQQLKQDYNPTTKNSTATWQRWQWRRTLTGLT
eukprot:c20731_g1_i2.p1 GENE.c20731_g1_i2~~c20731_g1_i2.p1  ORF type:complete len:1155 (+),score=277.93 c20731_g1_i2:26-3490(+)